MSRVESYSSLSTLASCAEKYRLSRVHRLEETGTNFPALNGKALHEGFRVLYAHGWKPELLPEAIEAALEARGRVSPPFGHRKAWLTPEFVESRLETYVEDRIRSPTILEEAEVVSSFSEEMHEFEWWTPDGGALHLRGIPDLVVQHEGKSYVVDNKFSTSGWLSSYYFLRFSLGFQLRIYAAMYEQKTGEHVSGGIINAVSCNEKSLDHPEKWKTRKSSPSLLHVVDFSPEQIEEAHAWARGLLSARDLYYNTLGPDTPWPRNELACDDYGGCEFLSVCTARNENMRRANMMLQFRRGEER